MNQLYKDPEKVKNWEFASELAFARLDKFVERVAVVEVRGASLYMRSRPLEGTNDHSVCLCEGISLQRMSLRAGKFAQ